MNLTSDSSSEEFWTDFDQTERTKPAHSIDPFLQAKLDVADEKAREAEAAYRLAINENQPLERIQHLAMEMEYAKRDRDLLHEERRRREQNGKA